MRESETLFGVVFLRGGIAEKIQTAYGSLQIQMNLPATPIWNEIIFWSIYIANLPDKIIWFFRKAPLRKWHIVFASVHRMTWNATLLNFRHE